MYSWIAVAVGGAIGSVARYGINRLVQQEWPLLRFPIATLIVNVVGCCVIGVLGAKWTDKFPLFSPVIAALPRVIRGVPGAEQGFHPNEIAGCLVLFVPLQTAMLIEKARRWFDVRGGIAKYDGIYRRMTAGAARG
jgi:uncharacterized membrane protein YoaK (UPF0700 family)